MMRRFFESECEEAPLRLALDAVRPSYDDAPEVSASRKRKRGIARAFVAEAAPHASAAERKFATELLWTTTTSIGKTVSERPRTKAEVHRYADAVASMLMTYLASLGRA
jgi:hypothetical protein